MRVRCVCVWLLVHTSFAYYIYTRLRVRLSKHRYSKAHTLEACRVQHPNTKAYTYNIVRQSHTLRTTTLFGLVRHQQRSGIRRSPYVYISYMMSSACFCVCVRKEPCTWGTFHSLNKHTNAAPIQPVNVFGQGARYPSINHTTNQPYRASRYAHIYIAAVSFKRAQSTCPSNLMDIVLKSQSHRSHRGRPYSSTGRDINCFGIYGGADLSCRVCGDCICIYGVTNRWSHIHRRQMLLRIYRTSWWWVPPKHEWPKQCTALLTMCEIQIQIKLTSQRVKHLNWWRSSADNCFFFVSFKNNEF